MADAFDIGAGVHSLVSAEYARRLNIPSQNSSDVLHVHCCVSFCSLLGQASLSWTGKTRVVRTVRCCCPDRRRAAAGRSPRVSVHRRSAGPTPSRHFILSFLSISELTKNPRCALSAAGAAVPLQQTKPEFSEWAWEHKPKRQCLYNTVCCFSRVFYVVCTLAPWM